ncbi:leucine-rich repeat domain-containing protein [Phaeodactylibacter luteus]|uniref:Leucine-rich repeat domain-containing protein n=1 Tax=Phaeodactylibacter luteus TaxID=1564516 RepID=A0A5C6RHU2_9BACT|nr:leucine-rich repeat domain-containing protein [Phaeodactylibacter luteus]TXB61673.1 leucine-rich repeat domain-containing protein [Phaeodactylibacter luteus]
MSQEVSKSQLNQALFALDQSLEAGNRMLENSAHRDAEWFDTPLKRLQWWLDLEPQWRKAFAIGVFLSKAEEFKPSDEQLQFLFQLSKVLLTGNGSFERRNNPPRIPFQLTNLSGLKHLTNITHIEVDYNYHIKDLSPLANLRKLETLWCDNNQISDLSPLAGMQALSSLCIWNNKVEDLSPLIGLPALFDLTIGLYRQGNPIKDYSPLLKIPYLMVVYLEHGAATPEVLAQVRGKQFDLRY